MKVCPALVNIVMLIPRRTVNDESQKNKVNRDGMIISDKSI